MNVEATDACNLSCSSCRSPRGSNYMTAETLDAILQKANPKQVRLHWRGEPCLHPSLPELAETAKKRGVEKLWLSTNTAVPLLGDGEYVGRLLSSLDMIECSVDGYDQKSLERYRVGASHRLLMRNLKAIGRAGGDCVKEMRVLMFRYNEGKEDYYRALAREHGFQSVSFAQPIINYKTLLSPEEADEWLARDPKYQRYERRGGVWLLKRGPCSPHLCVSVHGTAHPCGHDWHLQHGLGNLLEELWGDVLRRFNALKPDMIARRLPICGKWCCLPRERVEYRERL